MDPILQDIMADETGKPMQSYIALIATAILSKNTRRMLLSEIYSWIVENFPYYEGRDRSWRNSVRHNLSLNECFVKSGRGENGKGNYWTIHPANVDDFLRGDFRRRRARRRVRKAARSSDHNNIGGKNNNFPYASGYTVMKTTPLPVQQLIQMFGVNNVLSEEERQMTFFKRIIEGINNNSRGNPCEIVRDFPLDENNNNIPSQQQHFPIGHFSVTDHDETGTRDIDIDTALICGEGDSKYEEIERWHDTLPEIKLDDNVDLEMC